MYNINIVKPDSGTLYVAGPIAAGRRPAKSRWPIGHRRLVERVLTNAEQVPITAFVAEQTTFGVNCFGGNFFGVNFFGVNFFGVNFFLRVLTNAEQVPITDFVAEQTTFGVNFFGGKFFGGKFFWGKLFW